MLSGLYQSIILILFIQLSETGNPWTHVKDGRSSGNSGHKGHQLLPDAQLVRVSRGRTAAIKCHLPRYADTGPNLTVSWLRLEDVNLLSVGDLVYTKDKRISVQCEDARECHLKISEVRETDSGYYQCQANLDPGSWDYRLEVVEPKTKILGDKEVFINPNSVLNLTCQVLSPEPPHAIFWKYGEKVLKRNFPIKESNTNPPWTASLVININQRTESGRYTCSPSNTEPEYIMLHVVDGEALLAKQAGTSTFTFYSLYLQILAALILIQPLNIIIF